MEGFYKKHLSFWGYNPYLPEGIDQILRSPLALTKAIEVLTEYK
ncbi:hypothetical protein [Spirulina subsalsa]|nr:hypothetical protein [Spirulina subsalsa]